MNEFLLARRDRLQPTTLHLVYGVLFQKVKLFCLLACKKRHKKEFPIQRFVNLDMSKKISALDLL